MPAKHKSLTSTPSGLGICLIAGLCLLDSRPAHAWGALGHRMIAETAALLVADSGSEWGSLLSRHRFELGFYSFVPDSVFRHNDGQNGAKEAPTHYFDLDLAWKLGTLDVSKKVYQAHLKSYPRTYADAEALWKSSASDTPFEKLGTAPWRVEQMLGLAIRELEPVREVSGSYVSSQGSGSAEETQAQKRIFKALYYLGLMAHYSGDVAMPYHATVDWNGLKTGQSGIHFYFENDCVNALEPGLAQEALRQARKHQKAWLKSWGAPKEGPTGLVLQLLVDSAQRLAKLNEIDLGKAVLTPSKESKTPAKRKPASRGCGPFRDLLAERIAKGAVLTAYLWRSAPPKSLDLSRADNLQFSDMQLDLRFVEPKYDVPLSLQLPAP